jgi:large subunit ribosomal protein L23
MSAKDRYYQMLRKPVVTEKASDASADRNAYTFRVPVTANKVEIKKAVESVFDVQVLKVNALRVKGKWRRRGYTRGRTPDWKKAVVVLGEGQTIDVL